MSSVKIHTCVHRLSLQSFFQGITKFGEIWYTRFHSVILDDIDSNSIKTFIVLNVHQETHSKYNNQETRPKNS